ncbi:MAG: ribosome maturation factor RimP, partial [Candidatus Nitrosotenuis sp.]
MSAENRIREMLAPILEREGLTLYDVDAVASGPHQHLKIYIDRTDGVKLAHCETVSHQISALLDVEDLFAAHYVLEVSSPG